MTGVLPLVPKTAKVVPVSKKNSKLNCKNYALNLVTSHALTDIPENINIDCGVLKTCKKILILQTTKYCWQI